MGKISLNFYVDEMIIGKIVGEGVNTGGCSAEVQANYKRVQRCGITKASQSDRRFRDVCMVCGGG